ncbi:trafficking protein particle complex subunit 8 [Coccinella septempunctata]|uniref:trafficking protein particle complex subunit 8 n=1 Tax=Coccinella septempunctata TaxID=41139 RepID=UPI001D080781|nr:trafficking protein particle complex subunit 8 [Coccinella septempunctata]
MATCRQTPQEFIKNAFTPQIAVICSSKAEQCCEKNNLTFVELLQPFCRLNSEIHYKDHNGVITTLKNFKLSILDVNHRPPQTMLAKKHLSLSVSEAPQPKTEILPIGNYNLEIPTSTPWFEEWRETFLQVQYPSDHEYTKHFLACILVVSSTDTNPAESMIQLAQNLNQMYSSTPGKLPKWFSSNILKYYIIIHDVIDGNINVATTAYESIKSAYGSTNTCLLRMNSRPPGNNGVTEHVADPWSQFISNNIKSSMETSSTAENVYELAEEANEVKSVVTQTLNYHPLSPEHEDLNLNYKLNAKDEIFNKQNGSKVHGLCLGAEDLENIKTLIVDFTKNCLMPYVERQIQMLSENVSNKKGVSRSFLSATKRWFNPNKPGSSSASNNLMYASDSPELHVRKLGDLYFMFGSYSAAFQAYHLAKRDFNADQAWLYYAGALEMAALSAFMANESNRKTHDYLEESITTYLNTCKLPQFATRATLLGSECLKNKLLYGEAALQLIRMTSEESHLRSALLLEQASYCFLKSKMVRKYAFHMVLAGHRYSKAAQKKHSLRSYKQAYQVFKDNGWNLACDHILHTIGRQANNLNFYEEAVDSFSKLLLGESKQTAQQQITFLKEYLTILDNKMKHFSDGSLPLLPLPNFDITSSLKILLQPLSPLKTPGRIPAMGLSFEDVIVQGMEQKWIKLEEMLVQEAQGSLPLLFKPMITFFNNKKLLTNTPNAIVNEPIQLSVQIFNQLQMVLKLKDVYLLWTFKTGDKEFSNENTSENNIEKYIKTHVTNSVILEISAKADVILMLTPLHVGDLTVTGISYTLSTGNGSSETIFVKGKQLINLKGKIGDGSITEKLLNIRVVPPAPCLQVTFSEISTDFLCDEMQKVTVNFQNTGSVPLHKVYLASTMPRMVSNCEFHKADDFVTDFSDIETIQVREKLARKNHITFVPLPDGVLKSGETTSIAIWLKAPSLKGPYSIHLLIYYENIDSKSIPRYRLVRQSWNLSVRESIKINITPMDSGNSKSVEEISIGIKATNLNKTYDSVLTELTLTNVSLLSRHWMFIGNIVTPQNIVLHSQEAAHILLRTRRRILERSEYSSIPLRHETMSIANQLAYLAFAKKTEQRTINIFDDSEFDNFKENKDGILLIQWQALTKDEKSTRNANGQSFVPIKFDRIKKHPLELEFPLVEPPISLEDNDKKEKQHQMDLLKTQVTYNVICPPVVKHDFQRSNLCLVPVELLIHSVIDQEIIRVMVKTRNPVRLPTSDGKTPNFSPTTNHFRWLGSSIIIRDMKPLSTEVLRLSVATYGPGTFDLGANIEVYCSKLDELKETTLQNCRIHSMLIVTSGNS